MRQLAFGLLLFCLPCLGCQPIAAFVRTMFIQPIQYFNDVDCVFSKGHYCCKSLAAWRAFVDEHPGPHSEDFACGFKRGFADYLHRGGSGNPPALPPRCYWGVHHETPVGRMAVQQWFDGFRAGAQAAIMSGHRNLVVVPAGAALVSQSTYTEAQVEYLDNTSGAPGVEMLPPPQFQESTPK